VGDPTLRTTQLHDWLDRLRAGDRAAADELLRAAGARLERLAHHMLQGFPNVRRWADTGDVLQNAVLRLLRTLGAVRPQSARDFVNLAAVHVRRELLDLARHFGGPQGLGANYATPPPVAGADPLAALPDRRDDSAELEAWRQFHEAVERLPAAEREVVGLAFYHGWTHAQIAALWQVSDRTVRRHWQSACLRLNEELGGRLPGRAGGRG
jgi:RNA polymerase sigma-70 factor (ECF subfamily)